MKIADITGFKNQSSEFLEFLVRKHNLTIARVVPGSPEIACVVAREGG